VVKKKVKGLKRLKDGKRRSIDFEENGFWGRNDWQRNDRVHQ
jgi:hypothetical protein